MTTFVSRSQAGQDRFAFALLVEPEGRTEGTFLDIGCCHPIELSNTYALEELGWRGWLVDNDANAVELCRTVRRSPVFYGDATTFEYAALVESPGPAHVDYLSLDCDGASLGALNAILSSGLEFSVITIEHDLYRFGGGPRASMRDRLARAGYQRIAGDVCDQQLPFEDWWVSPGRVDMARAERYRSNGLDWRDVLRLGDAVAPTPGPTGRSANT